MTADSVDEYSTLQSATKGVYGPEIKAYGQKCLQFADKKFPQIQLALEEAEKAKLDELIKSKADMPETKNCPYCLQLIPFAAIKMPSLWFGNASNRGKNHREYLSCFGR